LFVNPNSHEGAASVDLAFAFRQGTALTVSSQTQKLSSRTRLMGEGSAF
jgi:hypothetical protein